MSTTSHTSDSLGPWARMMRRWETPADSAGLAVFRMLFGATACFGALRFLWNGWVDRFFVQPSHFLSFWGFEWVTVGSPATMHGIMWAMAALAACVAVGAFYRVAIVGFLLLFTYVELIDVANYLNHYVLVSMTAVIMALLPANAKWSVDALLWPKRVAKERIPQLSYDWLRFQVGAVWISASIAKMTPDWLLHAQPMNIWLNARTDTPGIGQFLDIWEVALAASWAGMLYDLLIVFFLMWKRTRWLAFGAVLGFHLMTHVWFAIGMFPIIMIVLATIFFEPSWPRRFVKRESEGSENTKPRMRRWMAPAFAFWMAMMMFLPVRFVAYGGNILWHEQGMRWAFKVMCREKNGSVTFKVRLPSENRTFLWSPREWLTPHQEREMSSQPDMVLRVAHDLADEYRKAGHHDVEVYADAVVSLNGRPPAPMIDPEANLAAIPDSLMPADWILPAPEMPPPRLGRQLLAAPFEMAAR